MKRRLALAFGLGLAGVAGGACSGSPRLPPGLPAPEYERPAAAPWPPPDAGTAARQDEPPATASDVGQGPAAPPAELGMAGAAGE